MYNDCICRYNDNAAANKVGNKQITYFLHNILSPGVSSSARISTKWSVNGEEGMFGHGSGQTCGMCVKENVGKLKENEEQVQFGRIGNF